jgi:hypothetical protein
MRCIVINLIKSIEMKYEYNWKDLGAGENETFKVVYSQKAESVDGS